MSDPGNTRLEENARASKESTRSGSEEWFVAFETIPETIENSADVGTPCACPIKLTPIVDFSRPAMDPEIPVQYLGDTSHMGETSTDPTDADAASLFEKIARSSLLISESLTHTGNGSLRRTTLTQSTTTKKPSISCSYDISDLEAGINLTKMMLGTGILFIPVAFRYSGLLLGISLMIFISYFTYWVFDYMAVAGQYFAKKDKVRGHSYSSTFYRCLEESGPPYDKFSNAGRIVANWLIALTQFSVSAIYVGIVTHNIRNVFHYLFEWDLNLRVYTALQAPFLLAILSVKRLKFITPMTLVAGVCLWIGIFITTYFIIDDFVNPKFELKYRIELATDVVGITKFFSIIIFAFGGVSGVLAIENNMKTPAHMAGCFSVISVAIALLTIVYLFYGILGYITYGIYVRGPISDGFHSGEAISFVLNLFLGLGVFFSQPVVTYPALSMILESFFENIPGLRFYLIRYGTILVVTILPSLIVTDLVALLGLLSSVLIIQQFIIPVIIDMLTWRARRFGVTRILFNIQNIIFLLAGLFFTVVGFYYAIVHVIESYQ